MQNFDHSTTLKSEEQIMHETNFAWFYKWPGSMQDRHLNQPMCRVPVTKSKNICISLLRAYDLGK